MTAPARTVDLNRERRLGRLAGAAGIASVIGSMAAVLVAASGSEPTTPGDPITRGEQLADLHAGAGAQLAGALTRAGALLLVVVVALYLNDAVRRREPRSPRIIAWVGVAGPALAALSVVLGYLTLADVAERFAAGPPSEARANALVDGSAALRATFWLERVAFIVFGLWVVLAALWGMRCGLLTRFLGIWGIGAGAASMFLPIGAALFLGWLGSVALLAVGYWPGGRPPAWDAGRAIPWAESDRDRRASGVA